MMRLGTWGAQRSRFRTVRPAEKCQAAHANRLEGAVILTPLPEDFIRENHSDRSNNNNNKPTKTMRWVFSLMQTRVRCDMGIVPKLCSYENTGSSEMH